MISVDHVQKYLEMGYDFLIHNPSKNEYSGALIFYDGPLRILDIQEVKVENFLDYFPNIQEELKKHDSLKAKYFLYPERKIITRLQDEVREGPYGENKSYQVVGDFQVEIESLFTAFLELNEKIAHQEKIRDKQLIKKGN